MILDDVDELLITMKIKEILEDVENDINNANAPTNNEVNFNSFDNLYNIILDIEDKLVCVDI